MGFEMMESGYDLKRINELKFRKSLENIFQSLEKQRQVFETNTAKPSYTASLGRQGTWSSPTLVQSRTGEERDRNIHTRAR